MRNIYKYKTSKITDNNINIFYTMSLICHVCIVSLVPTSVTSYHPLCGTSLKILVIHQVNLFKKHLESISDICLNRKVNSLIF